MEKGHNYIQDMKVRLIDDDSDVERNTLVDSTNLVIYLLVNPRSGSQEGRVYTDLDKDQFVFKLSSERTVELNIVDITKSNEMAEFKKTVMKKSKYYNDSSRDINLQKLIVVIAGGDGSFMNIVKEMEEHGVMIESIVFTVFPFGTSNDLSRAFNWGATPSRRLKNDLEYLCNKLDKATEVNFDVWEITIKTDEDKGDILVADGNNLVSTGYKTIKKLM